MRPGHLQVFDGLRITTEHLEHLQGALHSAIGDLRRIVGLGRVLRGFEVVPQGNQSIIVRPGLAFDAQGNRLVSDEARTLDVPFLPGEPAQFVCLSYDQVQTGAIEGRFTLIWDSCQSSLRSSAPGPDDNLLCIARVIKKADGTLEVGDPSPAPDAPTPEPPAREMSAPEGPAEPPPAAVRPAEAPEEGAPSAASPTPQLPPGPVRWLVRQGVARLAPEPGPGTSLLTTLREPLLKELIRVPKAGAPGEFQLRLTLAERAVALDAPVVSLSCQTILAATLIRSGHPDDLRCQVVARGEATFDPGLDDSSPAQWAVGTADSSPSRWPTECTESGIAELPLAAFATTSTPEGSDLAPLRDLLDRIVLLIRVERSAGLKYLAHLLWTGDPKPALIQRLEEDRPELRWDVTVAWKAFCQPERPIQA